MTALIYFNEHWADPTGRQRICRSSWDLDDYAGEKDLTWKRRLKRLLKHRPR